MTVADRIRNLREGLGMTQDDLALKMGYTGKSSISKIESSGDKITLKKIEKIAPFLHTSKEYLLGWVDDPVEKHETPPVGVVIGRNSQEIKEAFALYDAYKRAIPQVQSAVDALLK